MFCVSYVLCFLGFVPRWTTLVAELDVIRTQQQLDRVEQRVGAENKKSGFQEHKECAASSFQGCFDLVAATPETRRERCGASITLLCNKSGQIAVFFLNDPFLGGAIFCGAS